MKSPVHRLFAFGLIVLSLPVHAGLESAPLHAPSKPSGTSLFTRLSSAECGVTHVNPEDADHPLRRLYHSSMACGGVAIGDIDGDGLPDIYLTSGPSANHLFRNLGGMKFEDITAKAGVGGGETWASGCAMADVDNDGDLDIYVCLYDAPNQLFINDGKGVFTERASAFGLDIRDAGLVPAFADYDQDGDLDVFVVNNRYYWPTGRPTSVTSEVRNGKRVISSDFERYFRLVPGDPNDVANWKFEEIARPDILLRNDNGKFVDVSSSVGIEDDQSYGNSVTWIDYNGDGWLDIWVGNDFETPDKLYKNNGDGTFSSVIRGAVTLTCWYSMGSGVNDLNNDGHMDLMIADMAATTHYKAKVTMGEMNAFINFMDTSEPKEVMRNVVYLGTGADSMMEVGYMTGMAKTDWSWAIKLNDFDCDRMVDCFVSNGMVRNFSDSDRPVLPDQLVGTPIYELFRNTPQRREENIAFHNDGDLKFKNVSKDWGLNHLGMSYGAAVGDLDLDGDLDLVVNNLGEETFVYRNDHGGGARLLVALRDPAGNRFGIGARVEVRTASGSLHRHLLPHQGFVSSDEPVLHFGLGADTRASAVVVTWPDGAVQTLKDVEAGRRITVTRDASAAKPAAVAAAAPMFRQTQALSGFRHEDNFYDDLKKQLLLPNKLSNLGAGLAWGDVDGNGLDDAYLGGAAEQQGALYLQTAPGQFKRAQVPDFYADKDCEDMGAVFFDANGDGHLDLFVSGGSYEMDNDDPSLRDRLYLNDGKGGLTLAPDGVLPDDRDYGSSCAAADFDRDGDLDLIVGGRVIPGRYPTAPATRLLRNDRGSFSDITASVPGLREAGMVTGVLWSDATGDGWLDLLLTVEYGPVRLFENQKGALVEVTARAGLGNLLGWWNGIAGRDLDNDGDIDYLVTNFGLNTKYKADAQHPVRVYYGDFFDSGSFEVVEAGWQGDSQIPVRGRSCSGTAMPAIARKFPTFDKFARASLEEIYTRAKLDAAVQFACNTVQSGVLLNGGGGVFTFHPLPRIAQAGVAFSPVLTDLDGDGLCDAFVSQNFFHPQRETPRMGGGLGLVLKGDGKGGFEFLWTTQTGVRMQEDGRAATVLDFNGDGWADLAASFNQNRPMTYERAPTGPNRSFQLRLAAKSPGNPSGIGARVTVALEDGSAQTAEITAGSGYLSCNPAGLFFGVPAGKQVKEIRVAWPDGSASRHELAEIKPLVLIRQPAS